jgi:hypothetical protein
MYVWHDLCFQRRQLIHLQSSADSLASASTNELADIPDDNHVTEIRKIPGRPSFTRAVSDIFTRRLKRSSSVNEMPHTGVVIGVSTIVESHPDSETATIAEPTPKLLRNQLSSASMGASNPANNWMKTLATKLRRKKQQRLGNRAESYSTADLSSTIM